MGPDAQGRRDRRAPRARAPGGLPAPRTAPGPLGPARTGWAAGGVAERRLGGAAGGPGGPLRRLHQGAARRGGREPRGPGRRGPALGRRLVGGAALPPHAAPGRHAGPARRHHARPGGGGRRRLPRPAAPLGRARTGPWERASRPGRRCSRQGVRRRAARQRAQPLGRGVPRPARAAHAGLAAVRRGAPGGDEDLRWARAGRVGGLDGVCRHRLERPAGARGGRDPLAPGAHGPRVGGGVAGRQRRGRHFHGRGGGARWAPTPGAWPAASAPRPRGCTSSSRASRSPAWAGTD